MLAKKKYNSDCVEKTMRMKHSFIIYSMAGFLLVMTSMVQAQDFTWTYKSPMPHGKGDPAIASIGNLIYTFVGHTEPWTWPYGRICEAYNTSTDSWTRIADLPHMDGRYAMEAIAFNGKIYTFGGTNISGNYNNDNIDEYDPTTNTWVAYRAKLGKRLSTVPLAEYGGKIYCFGGGLYQSSDWWSNDVYEYDPIANMVTTKTSMPTKRGSACAATVGDKIYVIGGFGGYNASDPLDVVERYDPVTDQWATGFAPIPTGGDVGCGVINGKIYVNVFRTTEVYEYNPAVNTWTPKNPVQLVRAGQGVLTVDNKLYIMGGYIPGHITSFVEEGVLESEVMGIQIDIKPGSCPNPLNVKDKGILPVAVLGSENYDVLNIDPASIRLEGVAPIRSSYEDVATPVSNKTDDCDCTTEGPDGYLDLVLKFDAQEIVAVLGGLYDGDMYLLTLTGEDLSGTSIEGTDCVVIIAKGNK